MAIFHSWAIGGGGNIEYLTYTQKFYIAKILGVGPGNPQDYPCTKDSHVHITFS